MSRVLSRRKGKGRGRRTLTTGNAVVAKNATRQHASTIRGRGCTSKRSCGNQTARTDAPPVKRTTRRTRSTTEESQPSALTGADIPRIVDAIKRDCLTSRQARKAVIPAKQMRRRRISIRSVSAWYIIVGRDVISVAS